jgi:hypothetical protein
VQQIVACAGHYYFLVDSSAIATMILTGDGAVPSCVGSRGLAISTFVCRFVLGASLAQASVWELCLLSYTFDANAHSHSPPNYCCGLDWPSCSRLASLHVYCK